MLGDIAGIFGGIKADLQVIIVCTKYSPVKPALATLKPTRYPRKHFAAYGQG
jgi:hypothetical protein